jgi:very-short-patch-repair endonuclease
MDTDSFLIKAKNVHGDKYYYSLVDYKGSLKKIKIICKEHGVFETNTSTHLKGSICPKCFLNKLSSNTEKFLKKAKEIHGDKYDYSLVEYKKNNLKVDIICKKHGLFKQTPNNHLFNNGCPICKESKGEKEISKILKNKNINYLMEYKFDDCKNIIALPFDFYLPNYNICIEYDGQQHFKVIEIWGGKDGLERRKENDKIKTEYCKQNNIELIRIRYNENINEKMIELCQKLM